MDGKSPQLWYLRCLTCKAWVLSRWLGLRPTLCHVNFGLLGLVNWSSEIHQKCDESMRTWSRHIQTWGRQDANGSIEHRHWSDRPDAIYPDAFPDRKIYRTPFLRFAVFLGEILKETWFQSPAGAVEDGDVWAGEESWWRKFPLWSKHIMEVS